MKEYMMILFMAFFTFVSSLVSAAENITISGSDTAPSVTSSSTTPPATTRATQVSKVSAAEAEKIGEEAVAYGLPLIMVDLTKQVSTNVAAPQPNAHAPINQFGSMLKYPTATDKDIVRMNVDTLYTFAFLDLSKEPIVLSVPDTHGRYYLMPLIDAWTNVFASPGKRTTGTKAANFAIVGPDWVGKLPKGMKVYKAPTNTVMIAGRIQANGPAEYEVVNVLQKKFRLTPLSLWGVPYFYSPPAGVVNSHLDMSPPSEQVANMSAEVFFKRLAMLLESNPPPKKDARIIARLAKIGIVPGEDFDMNKLDPAVASALANSLPAALIKLEQAAKKTSVRINGWNYLPRNIARFGTDYNTRAAVALVGFGANLIQDAIYQMGYFDARKKPLNGANHYILHYEQGELPPVNAFWSFTMYDAQSFFVNNPINRYNIAKWMPLKYNQDGSLDIYIQHESPGPDKEANWLPAPEGEFNVTMRAYWPAETLVDGMWMPAPIIMKVQDVQNVQNGNSTTTTGDPNA